MISKGTAFTTRTREGRILSWEVQECLSADLYLCRPLSGSIVLPSGDSAATTYFCAAQVREGMLRPASAA